jgi:integrase/recombinase XerD
MSQGKQAKTLTPTQVARVLNEVKLSRYPDRDRVMVLLSFNAGLRAVEISKVTWGMVLDAEGNVSDGLELRDRATKGAKGGRQVPLCGELRAALTALKGDETPAADSFVIASERSEGLSAGTITVWFHRLYNRLGLKGASSHSGRRTFVTDLAKSIVSHGGSLRDVQQLAGHSSLQTTQRYIEGNSDAKRSAIEALGKRRVAGGGNA